MLYKLFVYLTFLLTLFLLTYFPYLFISLPVFFLRIGPFLFQAGIVNDTHLDFSIFLYFVLLYLYVPDKWLLDWIYMYGSCYCLNCEAVCII